MIDTKDLIIALMIGLGSTGHCMAMCGGISSSLLSNIGHHNITKKISRLVLFHAGRILCYCSVGLLLGSIIQSSSNYTQASFIARTLAGTVLIFIGLYIAGFSRVLQQLEKRMGFFWNMLQPLVKRYLPMQRLHHALLIGFLWGFLPCGIIYSTAIWASSEARNTSATVLMFAFGLGTLPGLMLTHIGSHALIQNWKRFFPKRTIGILMIIFGLWSLPFIYQPLMAYTASFQQNNNNHQHHHLMHH